MEAVRIENLTFTYPGREKPALDGVSLTIRRGDFVTLCGSSGCGKTTLLRQLKPSLAPHGVKSGGIFFGGTPLDALPQRDQAAKIGFVQQSPENQIVTDKVWHELAFGLESLGVKTPEIRLRVAEMASFFGIQTWFHKSVTELSGGQKQILNLASVMAMQPSVLILDEPTGQLDPIAASEFLATVGKLNRELGVTVILTEHRLEEAFPLSNRVVVLEEGRVLADGTPREAALRLRESGHGMFLAMPTAMRVWSQLTVDSGQLTVGDEVPVTVRDGAEWLRQLTVDNGQLTVEGKLSTIHYPLSTAITWDDVWFKYGKTEPDVVKGLSFKANYGEITAILGGNGTGKTTALSLAAGLNTPYRGKVKADARVTMLPQNPQALFVKKTVREDLLEMLSERKLPKEEQQKRLAEIAALCRLEELLNSHPYDLSGGEQQRAALAKVLLLRPKILLLDEPTKGLDAEFKQVLAGILKQLTASGAAVVIVSHDAEFCAEHADKCALFFDGSIVSEGTPRAFFSGNSFYTTSANRMARDVLPEAITVGDVVSALSGGNQLIVDSGQWTVKDEKTPPHKPQDNYPLSTVHCPLSTVLAAVMILLTIPLTIFLGVTFLDDRKYYVVSMLILLETMIPFALVFERRKPQARELVVIAVLCAIAVAGRAAFFMLPHFKPVVALVIIAGVAFGGEAGFLVGAMTGFVSNFFFGQGPWTPWQMFAFGVIGFLAGVLFRKGLLRRGRLPLALFGAAAAVMIYGGLVNPASILMIQPNPTWEMFLLAYLRGLPFDLVHAAATVTFILLISKPMLEKLDRIKIKYGLVE
ncbi:MAG: ATP-binding cassette domain-containing protein [Oscillospiraceae bacterium]|nr:ATP-binding cassette domain-containing protein [Oscillospiraceae bacterium]